MPPKRVISSNSTRSLDLSLNISGRRLCLLKNLLFDLRDRAESCTTSLSIALIISNTARESDEPNAGGIVIANEIHRVMMNVCKTAGLGVLSFEVVSVEKLALRFAGQSGILYHVPLDSLDNF
jgi:hypothetical protein